MKFIELEKADKPAWVSIVKNDKRHSLNTVISAIILLKTSGNVNLEMKELINIFAQENNLDLSDGNLETLKTTIVNSEKNVIAVKKDENSGDATYWLVTAISLLVYVYGLYGFVDFLDFSSALIGTAMIPLALSIVVHLFARKNFPKTLCYITVPLLIASFLGNTLYT